MNPARLVARARWMSTRELRFRAATMLRQARDRAAFAVHRPVWQRSAFASTIDPRTTDKRLERALLAAGKDRWLDAHRAVMEFVESGTTRFVLDPRNRVRIATTIRTAFPTAVSDAVDRAERVVNGRFDLLGYKGLSFAGADGTIDWHFDPVHNRRPVRTFWTQVPYLAPESGDHKIIWELNRHQHWMTLGRASWLTGDRRFRAAFIDHLYGWLAQNPPLEGINWASMLELSLRSLSWIWALHFFAGDHEDDRPWTIDLLAALERQLALVEQNLSRYFSPNTHLLGEALALYVAGRTLPLRRASAWDDLGRVVLLEEIARQVAADGGHLERSTHYHRYTLDFYILALLTARATGDAASAAFEEVVERLATFARTIADDRGRLPAIGDEDGGSLLPFCGRSPADVCDSLQIAATILGRPDLAVGAPAEEAVWITAALPAATAIPNEWPSTALPDTGYYVSRLRGGDQLTIDAGPHGYLNGGHAHADSLAIALTVGSRPLLVDPGTACYTIDPEMRDRFRSTALHNTLTLDGRSQSEPDGPFHWRSSAHGSALAWRPDRGFDYFEGEHDGYLPLVHQRAVLSRPGCWAVIDRVSGDNAAGAHRADIHWHVDPSWHVTQVSHRSAKAVHADGSIVWMLAAGDEAVLEIFRGATDPPRLGWHSPVYGMVVPSSTIRITSEGRTPMRIATVIVAAPEAPDLELVGVSGLEDAIGLRLRLREWTDTMVFAPRRNTSGAASWHADGIESDARVLCWRDAADGGRIIAMVDGTGARRMRPLPSNIDLVGAAVDATTIGD